MKKLLLGAVALTMLATACKKSDDSTPANSWKVGANSYTAATVAGSGTSGFYTLTAVDASANGLTFTFNGTTAPTAGTYKVSSAIIPPAGQVSFVASVSPKAYSPTGNDNISAVVTVNSGKVSVSLPNAWAKSSSSATDSVQVSANVTQTN